MERGAKNLGAFVVGAAAGVLVMALLDPWRGAARRSKARDKLRRYLHVLYDAVKAELLDREHRLQGSLHELRARRTEPEVEDEILVERVRSQMGKPHHHPGLEVHAEGGRVVLSGPVPLTQVSGLLSRVRRVRGVKSVEYHLRPGSGHPPWKPRPSFIH